jgi:hypothetical protein
MWPGACCTVAAAPCNPCRLRACIAVTVAKVVDVLRLDPDFV